MAMAEEIVIVVDKRGLVAKPEFKQALYTFVDTKVRLNDRTKTRLGTITAGFLETSIDKFWEELEPIQDSIGGCYDLATDLACFTQMVSNDQSYRLRVLLIYTSGRTPMFNADQLRTLCERDVTIDVIYWLPPDRQNSGKANHVEAFLRQLVEQQTCAYYFTATNGDELTKALISLMINPLYRKKDKLVTAVAK